MTSEACREVFNAAPVVGRAGALDAAFPQCACEPWSLTKTGGVGIPHVEKLARILTSPDSYDETSAAIITSKLTAIYSMGMSVVRQGASDKEIEDTVNELLTGGAEVRKLVGAAVFTAERVREFHNDDSAIRWFGVYATDDGDKNHHADIFGTNVNKGQQSKRRGKFADVLAPLIVKADTTAVLLGELRTAGI